MSEFKPFGIAVNKRFNELSQHELFVAGEDTDELWATYIASFPEGTNPVYKVNTGHECSCCRNFVKNLGNAVAIIDGQIHTLWDVPGLVTPYKEVAKAMDAYVLSTAIVSVLRRSEPNYGAEQTKQLLEGGDVIKWNHFHGTVARRHFTKDVGSVVGEINTTVQVFQRGLEELSDDSIQQVLDLIANKSLYRGEEHLPAIKAFKKHLVNYAKLTTKKQRKTYVFANYADPAARFRNTVIGTLVQDLSTGVDLEAAVRSFEAKVAPANYKRPTALITPRMVQDAMSTIHELGLDSALQRRFARISDVSVNNVLWVDNSVKAQMKDGIEGVLMAAATASAPTIKPETAEDIDIDTFMASVLPKAQGLDIMVKNGHTSSFMSVTAPSEPDTGKLFKWDNDFAWSYDGNITDSIKEKVKRAGGNVDAKLRFSLAWYNNDDLDFHCVTPRDEHIYFGRRNGVLDVDMNGTDGLSPTREPVENLSFANPRDGDYGVYVHQYCKRENVDFGFTVEIADANGTTQYSFNKPVTGNVDIGTFTVKNGVLVERQINLALIEQGLSQEKWGVKTETFAKVQTVMFSPNYWDENAVGNKHWFFILEGCKNPEPTRGIYNEFLAGRLDKHRKVFEILGDKTKCPVTDQQLSGLGFSSTRGDAVMVCVKTGRAQKYYNLKF